MIMIQCLKGTYSFQGGNANLKNKKPNHNNLIQILSIAINLLPMMGYRI